MDWHQLDESGTKFSAETATHKAIVENNGGNSWVCSYWNKKEKPPYRRFAGYDTKEDAMQNVEWHLRIIYPWDEGPE